VLGLFHRCYAPIVMGFGGVMWQRNALPGPGSVQAQDPWLMAALDYTRDVYNALAREAAERHRKQDPKQTRRGER
jgi:hypothetical protein